jgi:hypothetical protein
MNTPAGPPELSSATVARIQREESLRRSIQTSLATAADSPKKRTGVLAFLNSAFVLWALSAFFVTWGGNWYQTETAKQREADQKREVELKEEAAKKELQEAREYQRRQDHLRVSLEFSFRLSTTLSKLRLADQRFGKKSSSASQRSVASALLSLTHPPGRGGYLYPQHRELSGLAVLAELERHSLPGEADNIRTAVARLSNAIDRVTTATPTERKTPRQSAALLVEAMSNAALKSHFAFTDCSPSDPFCEGRQK